jgi:iron(II)-dependent oxidoreductase
MSPKTENARPKQAEAQLAPMAFMSYARFDDTRDGGKLTRLCEELSLEVRALSGKPFPIFQDKKDVHWGQEWQKRISEGINAATFFIPIVTPSFLASPNCMDELRQFIEHEKKLGRRDLILSIYYITCPGLDSGSDDPNVELLRALRSRQWADWRQLRHDGLQSRPVREKLTELAAQVCQAIECRPPLRPPPPPKPEAKAKRLDTAGSPAESRTTLPGMTFLRKNDQGCDEYRWEKDGSVMIRIPEGEFWMGSRAGEGADDEHPEHEVHLSEYFVDKCAVTNRQYKQFCDATGHSVPPDPKFEGMSHYFNHFPDHPVINVSWDDAKAYCEWADKRLPTEAEWEKAARGEDRRTYPWGNEAPDSEGFQRANLEGDDDGHKYTAPVEEYERGASPYGCLNMAGNVWEWCSDWYDEKYYGRSPIKNPPGPSPCSSRVCRGGSWLNGARHLRCANRGRNGPANRSSRLGFRCAHSGSA